MYPPCGHVDLGVEDRLCRDPDLLGADDVIRCDLRQLLGIDVGSTSPATREDGLLGTEHLEEVLRDDAHPVLVDPDRLDLIDTLDDLLSEEIAGDELLKLHRAHHRGHSVPPVDKEGKGHFFDHFMLAADERFALDTDAGDFLEHGVSRYLMGGGYSFSTSSILPLRYPSRSSVT